MIKLNACQSFCFTGALRWGSTPWGREREREISFRRSINHTSMQDNKNVINQAEKYYIIWRLNMKLDMRKHFCSLVLLTPLCQFHRHFPADLAPVFEIKPRWQSHHKTICQSGVGKGCLLDCDWSATVSLFPLRLCYTQASDPAWWTATAHYNPSPRLFPASSPSWKATYCNIKRKHRIPVPGSATLCQPIASKDIQLIKS